MKWLFMIVQGRDKGQRLIALGSFDSLANELKDKNIKVIYEKRLNKQNLNDILKSTLAK